MYKQSQTYFPGTEPKPVKPGDPGRPPPPAAAPAAAPAVQSAPSTPQNKDVVRMQATLIRIKKAFMETELFNTHGGVAAQNAESAGGSPFLTQLLDRNVNKNVGFAKQKGQPAGFKPWTFINRLESIADIGRKDTKGNEIPDGAWGKNTNKALVGMADIIETVYSVSAKLELPHGSGISQEDIQGIKNLIPKDLAKETSATLSQKAEGINQILESLEEKIEGFGRDLSDSYTQHTNHNTGMNAGFGFGTDPKIEEKISKLPGVNNSYLSVPQDILNPTSTKISMSFKNLLNIESLKSFITDNALTIDGQNPLGGEDDSLLNKFIDSLKGGIAGGQIIVSPEIAPAADANQEFTDPWSRKK